ncbi:WXG100-like domain-containing protein [Nocardia abscessus]|uniref:WXG100-like domain-containing protein n=1 Tax=Nocardia abscessus TaxID=120957 RepID=UPI000302498E|nr:hypothetical protein [Nocardia abscessus]MCC3326378.1 hypothetical protein [Nocardia abscessus]
MAIDLPSEVVFFLNICGIPYPDIDEDDVRALAGYVRAFAQQVRETHDSATGVINQMGDFYSGESYQQLVATWAGMSATHMRQLDSACEIVGQALDAAATVITVVKVVVLAELAALAAAYTSILLTPPLAPSAPLVAAAARRLCEQMSQYLIGYIIAEVIGKAIEPLEQAIEDMVKGVVYDATRDALDVPSSGRTPPLHIEPDAVQHFAKVLDDHADDILQHAATFAANVSTLDFTRPSRFDATEYSAVPDAKPPVGPTTPGDEAPLRPRDHPGSRVDPNAPVRPSDSAADHPHDTRVPVASNAVGASEKAAGFAGDPGARTGATDSSAPDSSAPQVAAEHRNSITDAARNSPVPVGIQNDPSADAAGRPPGTGTPHSVSAVAASDTGTRHAAVADSARSAHEAGIHRTGSAAEAASAAEHPAVEGSLQGGPLGVAPTAQQSTGAATTPWRRTGQQSATSNALPLEAERPAKVAPKGRRPAVTPWAEARRAREVPAVVHAPVIDGPPMPALREKDAEAGSAENAGPVHAKPAPSRATAPPSARMDSLDAQAGEARSTAR